jgi:hypothetical protein
MRDLSDLRGQGMAQAFSQSSPTASHFQRFVLVRAAKAPQGLYGENEVRQVEVFESITSVLLLPKNDVLEQDMDDIFTDFELLETVQLLRGGRHTVVRDQ